MVAALDLLGDTEIEAGAAGDAGHGEHVDVLEDARVDPAAHDVRHRLGVPRPSVANGASTVAAWAQARFDLERDLGGDGRASPRSR